MGLKVMYILFFTTRPVQDSWQRLEKLHMGHMRGIIYPRNGWHWMEKLHTRLDI